MKNCKTLFLGMAMCLCAVSSVTASSGVSCDGNTSDYKLKHSFYDDNMAVQTPAEDNLILTIVRYKNGNIFEVRTVKSYEDLESLLSVVASDEEIVIVTDDSDEEDEIPENNEDYPNN